MKQLAVCFKNPFASLRMTLKQYAIKPNLEDSRLHCFPFLAIF